MVVRQDLEVGSIASSPFRKDNAAAIAEERLSVCSVDAQRKNLEGVQLSFVLVAWISATRTSERYLPQEYPGTNIPWQRRLYVKRTGSDFKSILHRVR